jgi:integrase
MLQRTPRLVASPNKARLNDRFIRDLKKTTKSFLIWDTLQRGLVVQVQPSGHKTFYCIYSRNGRSRWYRLAAADAIDVAQARKLANEIMYQVANGKDPAADRKACRHAGTFEDLANRYANYAKTVNKSWQRTDALIKSNVIPKWGKLQAADITRADVKALKTGIAAKITANQVLASISAIFSWAIREEIGGIKINPCHLVERNPTKNRERILSDSELPKFWKAFDDAGLLRGMALKTILLTGQRPGEVTHMRTEDIIDGWWVLPRDQEETWPGTKDDALSHRVWLPKPVLDIIAEIEPADGFVFANSAGGAIDKLDAAMRGICKALGVTKKCTPHDLRRTHGSTITRLGFGRDSMDRIQNHKDGRVRDVYDQYEYESENRKIMEAVAGKIVTLTAK